MRTRNPIRSKSTPSSRLGSMAGVAMCAFVFTGAGCLMEPVEGEEGQYYDDMPSAPEIARPEQGGPRTVIELTREEAEQLEVDNGRALNAEGEEIAGGFIVLPDELTAAEKARYKARLLATPRQVPAARKEGDFRTEWCTGYYLANFQYQGSSWYFPDQRLGSAEGRGPITLTLTISRSVSATFSANVGVSAEVVSAGVGYSVTASHGVSSSGRWDVPSGNHGRLEGYALHDKHTWDVWNDDCGTPEDSYAGNGRSYKPNNGVYFRQVIAP